MVTKARPFKTDYAGSWCGHCATRESAIISAVRYMLTNHMTACTITGPDGGDVARLRRHSDNRGVDITAVRSLPVKQQRPKLRRVV